MLTYLKSKKPWETLVVNRPLNNFAKLEINTKPGIGTMLNCLTMYLPNIYQLNFMIYCMDRFKCRGVNSIVKIV